LPDSSEIQGLLASAYLNSGDASSAVKFVQSLISQKPNDAAAYRLLGDIDFRVNNRAEAIDAYNRSIELDPTQAGTRLELGNLFIEKGDNSSAAEVFRAAVQALPYDVDLKLALALAEDRLDRFEAARAAYEEVLRLRPRQVVASNNLAALIADGWPHDKKLLEQARRLAESHRNSTNPTLIDTLGWVEYRLGNLDDAVRLLQSAALDGDDAEIRYHLGRAYLAQGRRAEARSELKLAIAGNKSFRGRDDALTALAND